MEQSKQQRCHNNLLELEINNYEKSVEDLVAEKDRILNFRGEMESMTSVKGGLEELINDY